MLVFVSLQYCRVGKPNILFIYAAKSLLIPTTYVVLIQFVVSHTQVNLCILKILYFVRTLVNDTVCHE